MTDQNNKWAERLIASQAVFAQVEALGQDPVELALSGDIAAIETAFQEAAVRASVEVGEDGMRFREGSGLDNLPARTAEALVARTRDIQNELAIARMRDILGRGDFSVTRITKPDTKEGDQ